MSLHLAVQRCPQWARARLNSWLQIESALDCAIVSTLANTEEFIAIHCRHRCPGHCRLTVESTIEIKLT
eukprot:5522668-Lingulodinium_polyedra.AAC.1